MSSVVLPKSTFNAVTKFLQEEIEKLQQELVTIEEELKFLEKKYGIPSSLFLEMLQEKRKWSLPESSEPDVVEWEALLEQKKRLEKKIEELKQLWRQLQDYNKSHKSLEKN